MRHKLRGAFERLVQPDALETACATTVRGKRRRPDVAWLLFRRESVLERLSQELRSSQWSPDGFRLLRIADPKPRVVAVSSITDRVVHTALVHELLPVLERTLLDDTFACRTGRGTHRAVLRLQALQQRHRFMLHLDIRAFFPSIHLAILRRLLHERVRDERFLAVLDQVLNAGRGLYARPEVRAWLHLGEWPPPDRGLPVGAHTSQILASHLYLDGLDHHIKRWLGASGYLRYVDDLFLFADRRSDMERIRRGIIHWLQEERALRLKHPQAPILPCTGILDALGHRIRREGLIVRPRARRRLRQAAARALRGGGIRHLRRVARTTEGMLRLGAWGRWHG